MLVMFFFTYLLSAPFVTHKKQAAPFSSPQNKKHCRAPTFDFKHTKPGHICGEGVSYRHLTSAAKNIFPRGGGCLIYLSDSRCQCQSSREIKLPLSITDMGLLALNFQASGRRMGATSSLEVICEHLVSLAQTTIFFFRLLLGSRNQLSTRRRRITTL